jgi:lipopolysaccharide heptosyltransferase I
MLNGVPRILLVRLSAIGDVVRVLPAVHALRDLYPSAQLDFAVEPKSADIVRDHPALDQLLLFRRTESGVKGTLAFKDFCRHVRDNRYDIVVDFHGILKSGVIVRSSGAKERYGFSPPRSQEMSHLAYNHRVPLVHQRMNRIDENLELCKALGAKRHSLDVRIDVAPEVEDHIDEWIEDTFHGGKGLALVHAPVDRPEKQWPLRHFAEVCDMIEADGRLEVVLTWGPGQRHVVEEVASYMRREATISPELPDLKHFAYLAQRAKLFFGGDTGPMHIASAMDCPVVVVFGGTDPAKHGPMRKPHEILYAGPESGPNPKDLEKAQEYLAAIDAEQAYDACVRVLHQAPTGSG